MQKLSAVHKMLDRLLLASWAQKQVYCFKSIKTYFLGNETRIGIYARNCPEWFISALGCIRLSMVTVKDNLQVKKFNFQVPLYDTLGPDVAKFIVQQTEME